MNYNNLDFFLCASVIKKYSKAVYKSSKFGLEFGYDCKFAFSEVKDISKNIELMMLT
jgi:hypothetical protein